MKNSRKKKKKKIEGEREKYRRDQEKMNIETRTYYGSRFRGTQQEENKEERLGLPKSNKEEEEEMTEMVEKIKEAENDRKETQEKLNDSRE